MHIVLRVLGKIIVDYMRHSIDMDAPARHIRRRKYGQRTVLEPGKHPHPLLLVKVSGNSGGCKTVGGQIYFKPFRHGLGIAKEEVPTFRLTPEESEQKAELLGLADMVYLLFNSLHRYLLRRHGKMLRHIHMFIAEFEHTVGKRS